MAALSRLYLALGGRLAPLTRLRRSRRLSSTARLGAGARLGLAGAVAGTGLGLWLSWSRPNPAAPPEDRRRWWSWSDGDRGLSGGCRVYAAEQVKDQPKEDVKEGSTSIRKLRFKQCASMEYEGELYMTPRDFLFSVILEDRDNGANFLTGQLQAKKLTKQDIEEIVTKSMSVKPSSSLFRDLGDTGLISYTEYLFLLCILTKPRTGFHIAFSMLDTDGNQQVEKKEFLVLKKIIGQRKETKPEARAAQQEGDTELKTMLLVHFFGKEGKLKLQFKDFYRFMEDLQTEVQEIEFKEFSRGMKTMRREEFAAWLLHFTDKENIKIYWENVRLRIPTGESISFEEFRAFCRFMNHLEDFAFTMSMFTKSNRPVGIADFKRAVKVVTGQELSNNVLDTVFKIFDLDGDGCLSQQEFLGVIMTRLHRGLKAPPRIGLNGYLKCVKNESIGGVHEAVKQSGKSPF